MPRRPVKNPRKSTNNYGWKPGQSGNPAGKPRGTKQITDDIREAFSMLLQSKIPDLQDWLDRTAAKHPEKALDVWVRISERFVPMLSRTEITGKDGEAFTPITIHLPNIPKVSIGGGSPTDLALPTAPAEEIKFLGEPSASTFVNGEPSQISLEESRIAPGPMDPPVDESPAEAPQPMFQVPPLALSPNVLKDIQERGDTPLALDGGMGEPTR